MGEISLTMITLISICSNIYFYPVFYVINFDFFFPLQESWSFLRIAVRKFVVYDLPDNTEVGIIVANETNAVRLRALTRLTDTTRDAIASSVPYNPGDSRNNILEKAAPCLHCGLSEAINVSKESFSGVLLYICFSYFVHTKSMGNKMDKIHCMFGVSKVIGRHFERTQFVLFFK